MWVNRVGFAMSAICPVSPQRQSSRAVSCVGRLRRDLERGRDQTQRLARLAALQLGKPKEMQRVELVGEGLQNTPGHECCYVVRTTDWRPHSVRWLGPASQRCAMSEPDPEYERKRQLECLRLASDLRQLAKEDLEPGLKAHCLRMAGAWTDQAEKTSPRADANYFLN